MWRSNTSSAAVRHVWRGDATLRRGPHNAEESFRSLTPENLQAGRYVRLWKDSVGRSRSPEYGDSIDRTPQRWGRTGRVLQGTRAPKTASGVDCDLFGSAS